MTEGMDNYAERHARGNLLAMYDLLKNREFLDSEDVFEAGDYLDSDTIEYMRSRNAFFDPSGKYDDEYMAGILYTLADDSNPSRWFSDRQMKFMKTVISKYVIPFCKKVNDGLADEDSADDDEIGRQIAELKRENEGLLERYERRRLLDNLRKENARLKSRLGMDLQPPWQDIVNPDDDLNSIANLAKAEDIKRQVEEMKASMAKECKSLDDDDFLGGSTSETTDESQSDENPHKKSLLEIVHERKDKYNKN